MATIPQIRDRLLAGFPENQADLLAHVVIEAHDDLVHRADFHALTSVVGELATAQRTTEGTVSELVQTQNRMLIRLDRLDGRWCEQALLRHLPAYVGRVFRKCRVIDTAALAKAGIEAVGIVTCEAISPRILPKAQAHEVRVLLAGRLMPEAA